ncbi:hypothetical protein HYV22_02945 [Candidatus Gottesmanbacteria bacterium]|nr:hypothetical protein [Candidatus Gottesmanbacteria bacterium]
MVETGGESSTQKSPQKERTTTEHVVLHLGVGTPGEARKRITQIARAVQGAEGKPDTAEVINQYLDGQVTQYGYYRKRGDERVPIITRTVIHLDPNDPHKKVVLYRKKTKDEPHISTSMAQVAPIETIKIDTGEKGHLKDLYIKPDASRPYDPHYDFLNREHKLIGTARGQTVDLLMAEKLLGTPIPGSAGLEGKPSTIDQPVIDHIRTLAGLQVSQQKS